MAQASVLTDAEIRRVFRIIETTRHAERNRLAFVLSIYTGLRVRRGCRTNNRRRRDARRQRSSGDQAWCAPDEGIKGSHGGAFDPSTDGGRSFFENTIAQSPRCTADRITASRGRLLQRNPLDDVQRNLRACGSSNLFPFRKAHICDATERKGRWNEDDPKTDGSSSHRDDCSLLRCFR